MTQFSSGHSRPVQNRFNLKTCPSFLCVKRNILFMVPAGPTIVIMGLVTHGNNFQPSFLKILFSKGTVSSKPVDSLAQ